MCAATKIKDVNFIRLYIVFILTVLVVEFKCNIYKTSQKSSKDIQNLQFVEIFKITTLQMQICACNTLLSKEN